MSRKVVARAQRGLMLPDMTQAMVERAIDVAGRVEAFY
jgi:hypothetical protein